MEDPRHRWGVQAPSARRSESATQRSALEHQEKHGIPEFGEAASAMCSGFQRFVERCSRFLGQSVPESRVAGRRRHPCPALRGAQGGLLLAEGPSTRAKGISGPRNSTSAAAPRHREGACCATPESASCSWSSFYTMNLLSGRHHVVAQLVAVADHRQVDRQILQRVVAGVGHHIIDAAGAERAGAKDEIVRLERRQPGFEAGTGRQRKQSRVWSSTIPIAWRKE